jgi:beta-mannosidase
MIQDLNGAWQAKQAHSTDADAEARAAGEWLEATVPGCIHLDLMKAGKIPDPFYGFNDEDVQWVADAHWLYRRAFTCDEGVLGAARVELVCRGLDTFATVHLNGAELGRADNMFLEWRWDVTDLLKAGPNELLVLFESPRRVGLALMEEHGRLPIWDRESPQRAYTRKAQYASGWDWGPNLNTSGLWRPLLLEAFSKGRLSDVCARADWSDPARASIGVTVEVVAIAPCRADVQVEVTGPSFKRAVPVSERLEPGLRRLHVAVPVEDAQPWWPAGMGPQNLYAVSVTGRLDEEELVPASLNVGFRRVELLREKDDEGETFILRVNGEPVFCRGANWVPADSFLPRLTAADYEGLVHRAAAANMNMLRVWGGGVYESEAFFDACDRLGIMVWLDFMFACSAYPDHLDWFCKSVRAEAEQNVRRLRNHASLVLWCGSNENHVLLRGAGSRAGLKLYHEVLPAVCAELDPTRPYWPGSPYGGEDPGSPAEGDQHYWEVWHGSAPVEAQRRYNGRFVSEFGMQAPPTLETIRQYIPSGGHNMLSRVMEHHNRSAGGTEKLYRYLAAEFRVPGDFADTVYLMQLMQAEAVRAGVEHWRSRKFRTAGALFWQFNDCWPVTSWSCLDCAGRPKVLYYYARRFFAPVLPVIDRRDGRFTVSIVNDRRAAFEGELICGFGRLSGEQSWVERRPVCVPANGVQLCREKPESELDMGRPEESYFWCRLMEGGQETARNAWLLLPCKHMELEAPEWDVEVKGVGPRQLAVRVTGNMFARGTWLHAEGLEADYSDNFFDSLPELPSRVLIRTATPVEPDEVQRRLRVRSVAETQQGQPRRQ